MKTLKRRIHPAVRALLLCATLAAGAAHAQSPTPAAWGSFETPFSAQSPWNSRPVNPVFDPVSRVPTDQYNPGVSDGGYSTGVFRALPTDGPMTIYGPAGSNGVTDQDISGSREITIAHWPSNVVPAIGNDGHADIVDVEAGVIHSFWKLTQTDGVWRAHVYGWSPLNGNGFGDPAHFSQGARATGVPSSAGLIRVHELTDGKPSFGHALTMSLSAKGLTNGKTAPAYVYPATLSDVDPGYNTGTIAQGSLLMLPKDFDDTAIVNPLLKRVVATLKSYGAYVTERNGNAAFGIYVENGGILGQLLNNKDPAAVAQLHLIRAGLRKVVSTEGWVDGDGNAKTEPVIGNLLSMRGGGWSLQNGGSVVGKYDTLQQALVFPATTRMIQQANVTRVGFGKVSWALPTPGAQMRFTSVATGGASVQLRLLAGGAVVYDSGYLTDGQTTTLYWPANGFVSVVLFARSGVGAPSTVRGVLKAQ